MDKGDFEFEQRKRNRNYNNNNNNENEMEFSKGNDGGNGFNRFGGYVKSQSFSRVCHSDPENPGKMICKETNNSQGYNPFNSNDNKVIVYSYLFINRIILIIQKIIIRLMIIEIIIRELVMIIIKNPFGEKCKK